jgi:hypothetical protein
MSVAKEVENRAGKLSNTIILDESHKIKKGDTNLIKK